MIKALLEEVIIQIDPVKEKTESGILLVVPKHAPHPMWGTVYAIGEGVDTCKVGDRVLFSETHPRGFWYEEKPLLRVRKDQVIGVEGEDVKN